jgi:radical SAM protein with 4Fe4S-binding SPASM domain
MKHEAENVNRDNYLEQYGYSILQIETRASCNMSCQFCPYPLRGDKNSILPDVVVQRLIDEVSPIGENFEYICFSQYNEPLMDDRIFDFIKYARLKKIPSMIVTNALLLNRRETLGKLLAAEPEIIKISLQTINSDSFNKTRGISLEISKYFEIVYSFLSAARSSSSQIKVDIGCNFLNDWMFGLKTILGVSTGDPSISQNLKSMQKDIVSFLAGLNKYDNSFDINWDSLNKFMANTSTDYISEKGFPLAGNIVLKVKPFIYGRRIADFHPAIHPFACHNRILGVLADGTVTPCCLVYNQSLSLGNVQERSLGDIMQEKRIFLESLRAKNKSKNLLCRKCMGQPTKRGVWVKRLHDKILGS